MTSKSIIKTSSIVIGILLFSLIFFLVPKSQNEKYLPDEEKTFKVKISEDNNESAIYISVSNEQKNDFDISLYNEQQILNTAYDIHKGKDRIVYNYLYLKSGTAYTIKIKNKTDSTITSSIIIEDNN